jgi:hypothetical protein
MTGNYWAPPGVIGIQDQGFPGLRVADEQEGT